MTLAPYIESLQAELQAVAADLPDAADPEALPLTLAQLGDALRAGLSIPARLRDWACDASRDPGLDAALRSAREHLESTLVPVDADSTLLDTAVLVREGTESLLVATRYVCALSDQAPEALLPAWSRLRAAVRAFDEALAAHVTRHDVERALGQARALHRASSWTSALREPAVDAADAFEDAPDAPTPDHLPAAAAPSDEVVTHYASRGAHAGWVEAHAAADPSFREELREVIEMLRDVGEPVGLVARRWLALTEAEAETDATTASAPPLVRLPLPGLQQAAASDESDAALHRLPLGVLHPTPADALLEVFPSTVRLTLFADPGDLASASLGPHLVEAPPDADQLVLEANLAEGPWLLVVESRAGQRFRATLDLVPDA